MAQTGGMGELETRRVVRLTGVYHADGGLRGELAYVLGRARGTAHCALCDITHSPVRRKRAFDELRRSLGVPFDVVHLNERSPQVLEVTGERTPCVLAHTEDGGLVTVLGPSALDGLGGDVDAFGRTLRSALSDQGLALGDGSVTGPGAGSPRR